jgi:hypothetical protein
MGFLAVAADVEFVAELVVLERFPDHQFIGGIVLHQEDADRPASVGH